MLSVQLHGTDTPKSKKHYLKLKTKCDNDLNSNCDQTQNLSCDNTQKLKLRQNSKSPWKAVPAFQRFQIACTWLHSATQCCTIKY